MCAQQIKGWAWPQGILMAGLLIYRQCRAANNIPVSYVPAVSLNLGSVCSLLQSLWGGVGGKELP